jgi:CubicO group peptidase (beta-lactamase class C family)
MIASKSLVLALIAPLVSPQEAIPPAPELKQIRADVMDLVSSRGNPSLTVGVARYGEILWLESLGYADPARRRKADPSTVYPIGSMSKSVTAAAAQRLIDQGRLGLESSVDSLLPASAKPWDPAEFLPRITVGQLLNSTAGLSHGWLSVRDADSEPTGCYSGYPSAVAFPPGEVFEYSNHSFGLLQDVVAARTGQDFGAALWNLVFEPLGMKSSSARLDSTRLDSYAVRHDADGDPIPHPELIPEGGLGLYSSAEDLLRFGMDRARSLGAVSYVAAGPSAGWFQLGWWSTSRRRISNGSVEGANAHLTILPGDELVIVALTNMTSSLADEVADRILDSLEPGSGEAGAASRSEYRRRFRTPYAPRPKWSGTWRGILRSPCAETSVELTLGDVAYLSIAGAPRQSLENVSLNTWSELRGSAVARIPGLTPAGAGPHPIRLVLRLAGGELVGYASAVIDWPGGNASVPALMRLERQEPGPRPE